MKGKRWELPQKFRTIYWQNFALTASIVMLTLALLGASFFALSYAYAADERSDEMAQKASVVARLVASYASSGDVRDMREMAGVAASMTDVDFLVCSTEGSVLLTTDENLVDHVLTVPSDVMETALSGERYSARTTLGGIYESKRFVVGVPIESDIWTVGAVFAVTETGRLTTMWRAFFAMFLMTSVIVLLLSFVASAWVSMRQSRPIREMAAATRAFAEGNFDTRMHDYGAGEIGELASAFNAMADSLQETERQRREFIANVSHELKTPMTTIAGYTDGILDGTIPPEEHGKYLSIVADETKRLSKLINDLLALSRLERDDATLQCTDFDMNEMLRRAVIRRMNDLDRKRMEVEPDFRLDPCMVHADSDRMEQVVVNLLDNAIKFTPEGGKIRLTTEDSGDLVTVTVWDNGPGILPEDRGKVFDRFFTADRAHTAGKGTGLGLSICKRIMEFHGQSLRLLDTAEGTAFAFTLEKAKNEDTRKQE